MRRVLKVFDQTVVEFDEFETWVHVQSALVLVSDVGKVKYMLDRDLLGHVVMFVPLSFAPQIRGV